MSTESILPDKNHGLVNGSNGDRSWVGWVALLLFMAIGAAGFYGNVPPEPLPKTSESFSAFSARDLLVQVLGDEIPHPAGSAQNEIVRQRIVELVESWGYEVELHQTSAKRRKRRGRGNRSKTKSSADNKESSRRDTDPNKETTDTAKNSGSEKIPLTNIIFRRPGTSDSPPIMLVSHFDSAPASPGISDDGLGLAVSLEIARRLSSVEALNRDVLFLITDGEEFGLLGANRWCAERLPETEVGIAINVEARGTSGASLMFQTGPESRWLVQQFAKASRYPKTSSLFYEVYRFLPNDTDFTVLDRNGITGFNFAIVGNVNNYHTPYDNLDNLSLPSLQHHGENVFGLVEVLEQADLENIPRGRAVYFDLFGLTVVSWPAWLSFWISCLLSGGLFFVVGKENWKLVGWARSIGFTTVVFLAMAILIGSFVSLFRFEMHFQQRWMKEPLPVQLAIWALGIVVILVCLQRLTLDWQAWLVGAGIGWALLSLLTSLTLTGVSYMAIFPLLGIVLALWLNRIGASRPWGTALPLWLAVCCGAVVWLPTETLIYDALGFSPVIYGLRVAISLLLIAPALAILDSKNRTFLIVVLGFVLTVLIYLGLIWN